MWKCKGQNKKFLIRGAPFIGAGAVTTVTRLLISGIWDFEKLIQKFFVGNFQNLESNHRNEAKVAFWHENEKWNGNTMDWSKVKIVLAFFWIFQSTAMMNI